MIFVYYSSSFSEVSHTKENANASAVWFLVGNGGMDPYDSPLRVPYSNYSPYNPFPHSLLRPRQSIAGPADLVLRGQRQLMYE